jgi:hypothetical protein
MGSENQAKIRQSGVRFRSGPDLQHRTPYFFRRTPMGGGGQRIAQIEERMA